MKDISVVPHSNSTSNHNLFTSVSRRVSLFLIPILHQTTTLKRLLCGLLSCSSFQFYIKPQPITASSLFIPVVPHSNSTSNHNVLRRFRSFLLVVPHSNSTSNHNMVARLWKLTALFLIPILHQTTTRFPAPRYRHLLFLIPILHQTTTLTVRFVHSALLFLIPILHQTTTASLKLYEEQMLFLIPILHQTTTGDARVYGNARLFLIPILHQTTTNYRRIRRRKGCSSFQFYIKPQHRNLLSSVRCVVPHSNSTSNHNTFTRTMWYPPVVPHSNSTSNHNKNGKLVRLQDVVPHSNSTSNHNRTGGEASDGQLFLIPILHQTTTSRRSLALMLGCSSFQFYIKPQPRAWQ